jgi:hypothetical protein
MPRQAAARIAKSVSLSHDIQKYGLGDDDEHELLNPSSATERKFAVGRTKGENDLSVQVRCGEYTVVHGASGGHRDYLTHCDGVLSWRTNPHCALQIPIDP